MLTQQISGETRLHCNRTRNIYLEKFLLKNSIEHIDERSSNFLYF